jgi:hypothetical protein
MTILKWVLFAILLVGYFTFPIWALVLDMDILARVNSRLPPDKQFALIGSWKYWDLRRPYNELFPLRTNAVCD